MSPGIWQILLVVLLALLLFGGRGKISSIMGDFAKGIRSFRKGLTEDDAEEPESGKAASDEQKQAFVTQGGDDAVDVTPSEEAEKADAAKSGTA
ncbi:MAG: hypothetical protein Tsb0010_18560 [Parvularculaceae bacterium]